MLAELIVFNNFTIQVNQTIMLYALNLYSDVSQSFSINMGKKENWLYFSNSLTPLVFLNLTMS